MEDIIPLWRGGPTSPRPPPIWGHGRGRLGALLHAHLGPTREDVRGRKIRVTMTRMQ